MEAVVDGHGIPQITLPASIKAEVKRTGGKHALEALEDHVQVANARAKLSALTQRAGDKIKKMNANIGAVVRDIPNQLATVILSGAAGAYFGHLAYNYLRGYFGPASYAPDGIVIGTGLAVAYLGASSRVPTKLEKYASTASLRSALVGGGGGMAIAGVAHTYLTWIAA